MGRLLGADLTQSHPVDDLIELLDSFVRKSIRDGQVSLEVE